jgi:hypothetical protein
MSATDLAVATGGGNGHGSTWILVLWGVIAMVIGGAVFFVYGLTRI